MKDRTTLLAATSLILIAGIMVFSITGSNEEGGEGAHPPASGGTASGGSSPFGRRPGPGKPATPPSSPDRQDEPVIALERGMPAADRRALLTDLMKEQGLAGLGQLLRDYGADPSGTGIPQWLADDLEATIRDSYLRGELGTATDLLDQISSGHKNAGKLVYEVSQTLVGPDCPDRAFRELLSQPTQISPSDYRYLFTKAAHLIGYETAFQLVEESGADRVAKLARERILRAWAAKEPELAIDYVYGLPDEAPLRSEFPGILARYASTRGDFDLSEEWLAHVPDPAEAKKIRRQIEIQRKSPP